MAGVSTTYADQAGWSLAYLVILLQNYKVGIIILIGTGGQGQNPVLTGQFHVLVEYGLAFILLKNSKYPHRSKRSGYMENRHGSHMEKNLHSISYRGIKTHYRLF